MNSEREEAAITLSGVTKSFRKSTVRREYTTLKSEVVNWFLRKPRAPMALIEALRGVDLVVPRGKTLGVIGRNGSGKSTLLKLITGIYTPTTGTVTVNGRISALLDLGAGFHPDFSGRENILINGMMLGMTRAEIRERMDTIIAFSELGDFVDEPVRTYSSGMYMRLAFSVATHVDPDILIVDEILAVGDEHFAKKSVAKMTEFKEREKTIVLVTHDLGSVLRWCDQAAWIDGGRVRRMGSSLDVVQEYRQAVEIAESQSSQFSPPALAADGGALPSTPEAEPDVDVTAVRLMDSVGQVKEDFDTEEALQVRIEFRARPCSHPIGFALGISHSSGNLLYRTSTIADGLVLPTPLPPEGSITCVLERLGLLEGRYYLEIWPSRLEGYGPPSPFRASFSVRKSGGDSGVIRPLHRWKVDAAAPVRLAGRR